MQEAIFNHFSVNPRLSAKTMTNKNHLIPCGASHAIHSYIHTQTHGSSHSGFTQIKTVISNLAQKDHAKNGKMKRDLNSCSPQCLLWPLVSHNLDFRMRSRTLCDRTTVNKITTRSVRCARVCVRVTMAAATAYRHFD